MSPERSYRSPAANPSVEEPMNDSPGSGAAVDSMSESKVALASSDANTALIAAEIKAKSASNGGLGGV